MTRTWLFLFMTHERLKSIFLLSMLLDQRNFERASLIASFPILQSLQFYIIWLIFHDGWSNYKIDARPVTEMGQHVKHCREYYDCCISLPAMEEMNILIRALMCSWSHQERQIEIRVNMWQVQPLAWRTQTNWLGLIKTTERVTRLRRYEEMSAARPPHTCWGVIIFGSWT